MTATAFIHDPIRNVEPLPAPHATRPKLHIIGGTGPGRPDPDTVGDTRVDGFDPQVEIFRRRRFIVALVLTAVIVILSHLAGVSLTSFGPESQTDESAPLVHVVRPGDTYAGIAASLGAQDPQSFAGQLQAANAFAELVVGQRIVVDLDGLG